MLNRTMKLTMMIRMRRHSDNLKMKFQWKLLEAIENERTIYCSLLWGLEIRLHITILMKNPLSLLTITNLFVLFANVSRILVMNP